MFAQQFAFGYFTYLPLFAAHQLIHEILITSNMTPIAFYHAKLCLISSTLAVDLSPCIELSPSFMLHLQAPTPWLLLWRSCACVLHLNFKLAYDLTPNWATPREFGQAETKVTKQGGRTTGGLFSLCCCFSPPTKAIPQNSEQDMFNRAKAAKIPLLLLFVTQAISERRQIKRKLK